ncbi:C4-dicarboxylate ABC transporter [Oceanicola sp. 22II-s10i]|uniref:TRAP transporter small permease subunit n=1 Tax=Oceanicola sp. 22II-s10i TaxID=1317116 RepID=UPI000B5261A2|nr:TRAP transporter small permease subunit [Oceanicola sp. 22II-s10i]OWU86379.1 C4-dicarboxylate ABC transporter [Oceanicola sp. 22II-s10i]
MRRFIAIVDRMNRWIGRVVMYGIFVMMGILLWSSYSKVFATPTLWTLEMAQFAMVAYYVLGGPYSIQMGSNVRMDLLYGEWSLKKKAWVDGFTVFFLIFYLIVLLWGGLASLAYSLGDFSGNFFAFFGRVIGGFVTGGIEGATEPMGYIERSSSSWRPIIWPVKLIMCVGILLMLLQCLSEFFKDILRIRGEDMGDKA